MRGSKRYKTLRRWKLNYSVKCISRHALCYRWIFATTVWYGQFRRFRLKNFTRDRIIGKLEECRRLKSVTEEFEIVHTIILRVWRAFQCMETGSSTSNNDKNLLNCSIGKKKTLMEDNWRYWKTHETDL